MGLDRDWLAKKQLTSPFGDKFLKRQFTPVRRIRLPREVGRIRGGFYCNLTRCRLGYSNAFTDDTQHVFQRADRKRRHQQPVNWLATLRWIRFFDNNYIHGHR